MNLPLSLLNLLSKRIQAQAQHALTNILNVRQGVDGLVAARGSKADPTTCPLI